MIAEKSPVAAPRVSSRRNRQPRSLKSFKGCILLGSALAAMMFAYTCLWAYDNQLGYRQQMMEAQLRDTLETNQQLAVQLEALRACYRVEQYAKTSGMVMRTDANQVALVLPPAAPKQTSDSAVTGSAGGMLASAPLKRDDYPRR
jgi:hypothetical protein